MAKDAPPGAAPDPRRRIPRTDDVLAHPTLRALAARHGGALVKAAVTAAQAEARDGRIAPAAVGARATELAAGTDYRPSTQRAALNATGIVVHTNLGRAPLSAAAQAALATASGYVDVEYDAASGGRGQRGRGAIAALLAACPAAEDALVVNNGAAALSLAVTAFARDADVLMSRGELVEIGDGFRLPDLIEATGVRIVEVGTTNRTRAADYARAAAASAAAGRRVGAILKVHPSNFRVEGFTAQAAVAELADVAAGAGAPLVVDVGSGLLAPDPALPEEPDVTTALGAGAGIVTCSGDKLLGGPQAGLIVGRKAAVARIRKHPMKRALRMSKLPLAALEATLRLYLRPERLARDLPTLRLLTRPVAQIRALAQQLQPALAAAVAPRHAVEVVDTLGQIGSGSLPVERLPSAALAIAPLHKRGAGRALAALAAALRALPLPVIGRIADDRLLLDLRCLDDPAPFAAQLPALRAALAGQPA